jgi:hypothetical protein
MISVSVILDRYWWLVALLNSLLVILKC